MTKTQTSDILQHLKDGRKLTQKESINEYGAYRLSAIIHSLRKKGHLIESIPLKVTTRYIAKDGNPKMANIVEYKLDTDNNMFGKNFDERLKNFMGYLTDITNTHSK